MQPLPRSLESGFQATAAELGWCSASRLYARELIGAGGRDLLARAVDQLGRGYPVFACVVARYLDGGDPGAIDPEPAAAALGDAHRVVFVGIESDFLDALVPRLDAADLGLVTIGSGIEPDWRRVLANFDGRVAPVALADVQRWSGRHSALLTFVYGSDRRHAHVVPAWLRISGPDVRTQFRTLAGWDVLGAPMPLYPRWLVSASLADFSHFIAS